MKIIITRPLKDATPLAGKLKSMGHEVVVAPLLEIVARAAVTFPKRKYQAICLTSANGVRVLKNIGGLKSIPVFAVGPQSMQVAIERGFLHVQAKGGDVVRLAAHIAATLKPDQGPILYISGSETSGDLEGKLRSVGFDVDRVITYDAKPASLLGFEAAIESSNAVLLYSPRSAKLWVLAVENLQLQTVNFTPVHICLSQTIAAYLPENWQKRIAESPTEAALIAALDCKAKAE